MRTREMKSALITGGASGMGRGAALALAAQGIRVFTADLNLDAAEDAARTIQKTGGRGPAGGGRDRPSHYAE